MRKKKKNELNQKKEEGGAHPRTMTHEQMAAGIDPR